MLSRHIKSALCCSDATFQIWPRGVCMRALLGEAHAQHGAMRGVQMLMLLCSIMSVSQGRPRTKCSCEWVRKSGHRTDVGPAPELQASPASSCCVRCSSQPVELRQTRSHEALKPQVLARGWRRSCSSHTCMHRGRESGMRSPVWRGMRILPVSDPLPLMLSNCNRSGHHSLCIDAAVHTVPAGRQSWASRW